MVSKIVGGKRRKEWWWWNRPRARCLARTGCCVWAGATYPLAEPKCRILGPLVPPTPFSAAHAGRTPWPGHGGSRGKKARMHGPARRPRVARGWKEAPSQVRGLPPQPPSGQGPSAPRLGPVPGAHLRPGACSPGPCCLCAHQLSVAPSPAGRPPTRHPLFNENEKGCRFFFVLFFFWTFGPNLSVAAGDAGDTEDRPGEGVTPGPPPGSDGRAGPSEKKRVDTPRWRGEGSERMAEHKGPGPGGRKCGPRSEMDGLVSWNDHVGPRPDSESSVGIRLQQPPQRHTVVGD